MNVGQSPLKWERWVRRADDADQDEISAEVGESWCGGTQGAHPVLLLSPRFLSPKWVSLHVGQWFWPTGLRWEGWGICR